MKKVCLLLVALWLAELGCKAYDYEQGGIYYNLKYISPAQKEEFKSRLPWLYGNSRQSPLTASLLPTTESHAIVTYLTRDEKNLYVSPYSGSITIPDTIYRDSIAYPVLIIGEGAFANCRELTAVTLPSCVRLIGLAAFGNCESLSSITLPDSLTTIGKMAFYNCKNLTSIQGGQNILELDESAFVGCTALGTDVKDMLKNIMYGNMDAYLDEHILQAPDQDAEFKINPSDFSTWIEENPEYRYLPKSRFYGLTIWLGANFQWPKECNKKKIKGRVDVWFVVEKDGSITNVAVTKSPHQALTEEYIRLFNSMPKWKPAMERGRPARQRILFTQSFPF